MGRLVQFPPSRRPRPAKAGGQTSAEILVFTGVRYIRQDAPHPKASGPTPHGPTIKRG